MLIIGAKGFAKEVLQVCHINNEIQNLQFYDDINLDNSLLFEKFKIIHSLGDAKEYFKTIDSNFTIGLGNPLLRYNLYNKFKKLGGIFTRTISNNVLIGFYDNKIGDGCNIMNFVSITNSVEIGIGVLINQLTSIGHDVIIGDFCEICPNVTISGNVHIGEKSFIGSSATILPNINIGKNVVIGAGALVNKDIPDNSTAFGVPVKIVKQ